MKENNNIPLSEQYTLTIKQASQYFNIGEKKIYKLIRDNPTADYVLMNGSKTLIKRKRFEQYIEDTSSI